ncbi:magnesium transporter CorA family protein [Metaclostridioides mangenotii]|jgi:magnesium transporter|uniref:Magnesium transporter n=1 Tax=Metaclostridioides mangenotii TaxID=1540 RepID=A0ABS4E887_9FIRM|nr:CorA family divalent cation transporter [Clostridioides mangenotii]MBP1854123.1 magnesium transporter [Clostridioides mangenotii]
MYVLNLNTKKVIENIDENFYNKENSYVILCNPENLLFFKDILNIDETSYRDSLRYDDVTKLHLFDEYDYLSLNTFEIKGKQTVIEEVNIYLADNFILVVVTEEHFIFELIKNIMFQSPALEEDPQVAIFQINYSIFKEIIVSGFESLEAVEDLILEIEDDLSDKVNNSYSDRISYVRGLARDIVKTIRPLLYIGDRAVKENVRYLKYTKVKKYCIENMQRTDLGVDRLYNFAISTRELSDKLLDIYSSKVGEKTNNLITKLTLVTAISAPLTIITGIYGMNFRHMPELGWVYGYPFILLVMLSIVVIGFIIFKIKKLL